MFDCNFSFFLNTFLEVRVTKKWKKAVECMLQNIFLDS